MLDLPESMCRLHRVLARLTLYTVLSTWLATVVPVVCEHGLTSPYVHARFGHGAIHVALPVSQAAVPVASQAAATAHDETHESPAHRPHAHRSQRDGEIPVPASAPAVQGPAARSAPPAHVHPAALSATVSSQPQSSGPLTLLNAGLLVPAQPPPAAQLPDTSLLSVSLPPGRLPDPPPERPPAV